MGGFGIVQGWIAGWKEVAYGIWVVSSSSTRTRSSVGVFEALLIAFIQWHILYSLIIPKASYTNSC